MSYIHEALKKAQKEKDNFHKTGAGVVSVDKAKKTFLSIRLAKGSVFIAAAIVCVIGIYSWLDIRPTENQTEPVKVTRPLPENKKRVVPFDREDLNEKAKFFIRKREFDKAGAIYRKILSKDPGDVKAMNNLAVVHMNEKEHNSAQRLLEKAVRLRPSYVDSIYNLACLYSIKGDVSGSIHYLKKAVSLNPVTRDWAREDADLINLKGISEFEEIISRVDNQ